MPLSTDVDLPRSTRPIFPNACVACGCADPACVFRLRTFSLGWHTLLLHPGGYFAVDVPACRPCRARLRRRKWLLLLVTAGFVAAGIAAYKYFWGTPSGPFRKWILAGFCLIVLAPLIGWEMIFPPPIDITAFKDTISYEFRDPLYAEEFAHLNQS